MTKLDDAKLCRQGKHDLFRTDIEIYPEGPSKKGYRGILVVCTRRCGYEQLENMKTVYAE